MTDLLDTGHWFVVRDGDDRARSIYLRHYSAKDSKAKRTFIGPGEKLVLLSSDGQAVWGWRKMKFRKDGQTGVENVLFRNEGSILSSELILEAEQRGWRKWPGERLWTYVDPNEVESKNAGYCFQAAGWDCLGLASNGLLVYEKLPSIACSPEMREVIDMAELLQDCWNAEDSDWFIAAEWLKEAIEKMHGIDRDSELFAGVAA
jgi:hypothetical protein